MSVQIISALASPQFLATAIVFSMVGLVIILASPSERFRTTVWVGTIGFSFLALNLYFRYGFDQLPANQKGPVTVIVLALVIALLVIQARAGIELINIFIQQQREADEPQQQQSPEVKKPAPASPTDQSDSPLGTSSQQPSAAMFSLENPAPGSFQSGIGVISGFVCDATQITIEFDGAASFEASYGTSRGDTVGVCGDANNGFSLLFNWNLLGDGVHTVRVLADGVAFAEVAITVTTLGLGEFPTGLSGEFTLQDFPREGTEASIQWQQSQQNFVIVDVQ